MSENFLLYHLLILHITYHDAQTQVTEFFSAKLLLQKVIKQKVAVSHLP